MICTTIFPILLFIGGLTTLQGMESPNLQQPTFNALIQLPKPSSYIDANKNYNGFMGSNCSSLLHLNPFLGFHFLGKRIDKEKNSTEYLLIVDATKQFKAKFTKTMQNNNSITTSLYVYPTWSDWNATGDISEWQKLKALHKFIKAGSAGPTPQPLKIQEEFHKSNQKISSL